MVDAIDSAPFHHEMCRFSSESEIEGTFGRDGLLRVLERDVRLQIERGTGVTALKTRTLKDYSNSNRRRYRWLRLVPFQHEIIKPERKKISHSGIDLHGR